MEPTTRKGRHARPRAGRAVRERVVGSVGVGVLTITEFCAALLAASSVTAAVALVAGVILAVSCVIWPTLVMSAAFPASFATWRVGPSVVDMSIADVIGFIGAVAALPHVPWRSRAFRRLLAAAALYAGVVGIAVVAHASTAGAVEIVHRFVMVVGGVCIGAAIVRTGKVTAALRLLVLMALVVAVAAVVDTLSNNLDPAYALGLQKNAAGSLLVGTILAVFLAERRLRWPRTLVMPIGVVLLAGLAATQSRGAGTALGAVILMYFIRSAWHRRARRLWRIAPLVLLLGGALTVAMVRSYQSQAKAHEGTAHKFGSVGSREITYSIAWDDIVQPNPALGIGPKWFNKPSAPGGEPHNIFLDEVTSDGFLGLAAFLFLLWTALRVTRATRSDLGELAFYALAARVVATCFDIFWVAGPNTLPFLIVGLAVGAASLDEERAELVEPDAQPERPPAITLAR